MEYGIQEVARIAGVSSRTLRHYDQVGLLPALRSERNGYRVYDDASLGRLQRILLLRDLGVGLDEVRRILEHPGDRVSALETHRSLLEGERERLDRMIASVDHTLGAWREGEEAMAEKMFDGFDHTRFEGEVRERWGADRQRASSDWWEALGDDGREAHRAEQRAIAAGFAALADEGVDPASPEARSLARRQLDWVSAAWGGRRPTAAEFEGLAEMYVSDPRFASAYAPATGYVRDALASFARDELE
ncbi:MerR family transcriptional regulator [Frondihabitans australicus]|uniref:DNA-binding transcriptional MerR regulator n=1 Tax=Frondihabitans australicus TaxID=386892 RepID=A0A495IJR3_9MICO|nr:MerR family transcriptional regulator [Frondihabitans australicus]RKR76214.1 DNA-binding transcriptional MerR regulator [Frondihabitans australicus]